ncbi:MAG: Rrf2 family transcriptional regulator [Planctomycetota bacterium]
MMINAAAHYACLAMLDLSLHADSPTPVRTSEITRRNQIPGPYLNQILRTLKANGWVHATRGSQGGYRLAIDADSITLLDIVEAIGCIETYPGHDADGDVPATPSQALQECWSSASESARCQLAQVRLGDLARQCRDQGSAMFYI